MNIEEQLASIDQKLGIGAHEGADARVVEAFRAAGFDEATAARGARLLHENEAWGFERVATELATEHHFGGGATLPNAVRRARIAEAGKALAEARPAPSDRPSPWGRKPVKESTGRKTPWGRSVGRGERMPTVDDFTSTGLNKLQAEESLQGLRAGRFVSYEDACLSVARRHPRVVLKEDVMRERARGFHAITGE